MCGMVGKWACAPGERGELPPEWEGRVWVCGRPGIVEVVVRYLDVVVVGVVVRCARVAWR